ncbi:MAG: hypoxanthine phosphoribosyltransferase [Clostridiales bacterium]|nr:hypoxanthine phosphoribosyltransferase [Clostridiales bacterium]
MQNEIEKILYTEEQIQEKVKEIANLINKDYKDKNPLLIGVLKGAFLFTADLVKRINIHCNVDFMIASSYGNSTTSSGNVKILKDIDYSLEGRDILIVEDIIESGISLDYLVNYLKERKANSVEITTLLDKPSRRKKDVYVKYVGFTVPDEFLVGYGLDYAERYRNLPYIGTLKPEIYEK